MNRIAAVAALTLLVSSSLAHAADEGPVNLFISPCGQPFTAPVGQPYPIVLWFKGADKNADGKLDKLENRADADAFFTVLDRNKDGFIGSQEVLIYERYYVPEILSGEAEAGGLIRVVMQDEGGDEGGGDLPKRQRLNTNQGAVPFSLFREPEPVRAADRNFDYKVSRQEFADHADRHFAALDVDGDGFIALNDLPQTQAERTAKAKRN